MSNQGNPAFNAFIAANSAAEGKFKVTKPKYKGVPWNAANATVTSAFGQVIYIAWNATPYNFTNVVTFQVDIYAGNPQPIWVTYKWPRLKLIAVTPSVPLIDASGYDAAYETAWGPYPPAPFNIGIKLRFHWGFASGTYALTKYGTFFLTF